VTRFNLQCMQTMPKIVLQDWALCPHFGGKPNFHSRILFIQVIEFVASVEVFH